MNYAMSAVSETSQRISSHRRGTTLSNWSNRNLCMCLLFQCRKSVRFQKNPCRWSVLCIYILKRLLLVCGGDKSNHIRKTCSAQAEKELQVYMMPRRKRPCYPQRQASNICGPNFSVRELHFFSFKEIWKGFYWFIGSSSYSASHQWLPLKPTKCDPTSQSHAKGSPCLSLRAAELCLYQPEDTVLTFQQNN